MSMTEFIQYKIASGLSQATIDSYCYALRDFVSQGKPAMQYFADLRKRGFSATTIRDKYAVISCYFRWCEKKGYPVQELPKKPALPKQQARCFTEKEISTIIRYLAGKQDFCGIRDYAVICTLLGTGIRKSELLSISGIDGDYLTVNGKTGVRTVPIAAALRNILKKYVIMRNERANTDKLFITKSGGALSKDGLRAIFTRLSRETGIAGKRFSPHSFRHSFATGFLRNGGDLGSLQRILGHSNISTTAIYLHYDLDSIKNINEKVNPLKNFKIYF
jgi:integrase/recombinase XerD